MKSKANSCHCCSKKLNGRNRHYVEKIYPAGTVEWIPACQDCANEEEGNKKEVKISLKCSRGIPCCRCESKLCALGVFDYDTYTIFLGAAHINAENIEGHIEDTLNHELRHAVLFKLFGEEIARKYDLIYYLAEPRGGVVLIW